MRSTTTKDKSSPFADFIFGIIFICCSFPVLWNNERKQVRIASLLSKARKECVEVNCKSPEDANNYKLVYASGETTNESAITDREFNISVDNCVKICRVVEMYQWVEHTRKEGEHTHYSYSKEWKNFIVSSSNFRLTEH